MTTKQKLQQFKDYYLGGTLAVIAAAALIIFMVSRFLMPQKEAVLNIAVFDTELSDEAEAQLAQEITKGNYDLGFITLPANYDEKALENALEQNITRFLLELGTGFAFVGRQKEIVVSGKTRKIDLLFYHIRLRCYVVVELKVTAFEPEFAGKLNFYVSAVDELIKASDDNPTIGLLICKDMDRTEVQWSFRNVSTPLGVATYSNVQIANMEAVLPTTEQIAERVRQAEEEFNLSREAAEKEQ